MKIFHSDSLNLNGHLVFKEEGQEKEPNATLVLGGNDS